MVDGEAVVVGFGVFEFAGGEDEEEGGEDGGATHFLGDLAL